MITKQIKSYAKKNIFVQKYIMHKVYKNQYKQKKIIYKKSIKEIQLKEMLDAVVIEINPANLFQHWIDESILLYASDKIIGNMPPDYSLIINNSLHDLKDIGEIYAKSRNVRINIIDVIEKYLDRIINQLEQFPQNENIKQAKTVFQGMKKRKADNLADALQRILFWSSLFWQSGHRLMGLGRLDKILQPFEHEFDSNQEKGMNYICAFMKTLNENYEYKSNQLLGDTGQIIILGGLEQDNSYYYNCFTTAFIHATMQLQQSDPKLLLRVSSKMPNSLIEDAVQCISSGIGSPLLSNDDVVIPNLIEFGYERMDAYNYVTSACWEPLSYTNSLEQNNIGGVNIAQVFVNTMKDDHIIDVKDFRSFFGVFKKYLVLSIQQELDIISKITWEDDPLFSIFTSECNKTGLDIAQGGAKYNNYGMLIVGLSNAINSLINVREFVFEQEKVSLNELHNIWKTEDEEQYEALLQKINLSLVFGHDSEAGILLVNEIMDEMEKSIVTYRNRYGGTVKIGLSSPAYVTTGKSTIFTFDGRKAGQPLAVHISPSDSVAYTELVSFASKLKYSGLTSNANVVDFFVSPNFILDNFNKFVDFIHGSIISGFFQMQMNVVGSETLIEAQNNPDLYKGLIVRVWGFSAYFNDLPKEYQDNMIKRALINEGKY